MNTVPNEYTVFSRYLLLFAAGASLGTDFFTDPSIIELVASLLFTLTAVVWYRFSEAREAYAEYLAKKAAEKVEESA